MASVSNSIPTAFISSVFTGLEEYRQAAIRACTRARVLPVGMEFWTAVDAESVEKCKIEVANSDLVILILLHRAGSIHTGSGKSYTEIEFDHAMNLGIPVLAFKGENLAGIRISDITPDDLKLFQAFEKKLGSRPRGSFNTKEDLELKVYQALTEWMNANRN